MGKLPLAVDAEQVLNLAATLRDAPPAGTFVGIGGACFDIGTPLTASVAAALPSLVAAIAAEVAAIADRAAARLAGPPANLRAARRRGSPQLG